MKIVLINGSPRETGLTASLLHDIERCLDQQGAEVEFYNLSKLSMAQCRGCCACYKTGRCIINDDAEMLSDVIAGADGVIFGTPTYASNVSGFMKLLIDRGHFVIEQLLTGKYCVTVTTGENYGSKDASDIMNKLVLYSGGRLVKTIVINAPFNGGIPQGSEKYTERAAIRLCNAIKAQKSFLLQSIVHKLIFSLGIRPFVLNKGDNYSGVTAKWKEYGI